MCGIAGKYNYQSRQPVDPNLLKRMSACIAYRGPDDEGSFLHDESGLGFVHRRLSIIDLSTGHQPMFDETGNYCIVFNGEIYNFRELRQDLETKGHTFQTSSDTEVVLELYKADGDKAFARLNGIFALAMFRLESRELILARDQFGVKPLYYHLQNGSLVFGSEIKAILEDNSIKAEIDYEALNSFLTFRYNPAPQTLFKGVCKLVAGHYLKVASDGSVSTAAYSDYSPQTDTVISEEDAIRKYQLLLENAVRRQMVSDVPVGLLLSGGIDSAVIGSLMKAQSNLPVKSFSIGFEGNGEFNELEDAKKTSHLIGSEHHAITISRKDYLSFFTKSFRHIEEPIAETSISALYYVSRLAREHVKVVLAGQGADEPLAGYHRYIGEKYLSRFGGMFAALPLKQLVSLFGRNERLKRAEFASRFSNERDRFLAIYTIFTPEMKSRLLNEETKALVRSADQTLVERLYSQTYGMKESLNKLLFIDTRLSLSDDLLLFGDKVTMANSIEMRVPFLDTDIIRFLETLPSQLKLRGRTGKYIHKKALSKWLPPDVINREKRGFATPMDTWLQKGLATSVRSLINDSNSACRRYFSIPFLNEVLDSHESRKENYQRHIFSIMSFELWHRTFIDKQPIPDLNYLAD